MDRPLDEGHVVNKTKSLVAAQRTSRSPQSLAFGSAGLAARFAFAEDGTLLTAFPVAALP